VIFVSSGVQHTEEWWLSIPEDVRPHKDQPFYHLLAENSESEYVAYVSEQNLCLTIPASRSGTRRCEIFVKDKSGSYRPAESLAELTTIRSLGEAQRPGQEIISSLILDVAERRTDSWCVWTDFGSQTRPAGLQAADDEGDGIKQQIARLNDPGQIRHEAVEAEDAQHAREIVGRAPSGSIAAHLSKPADEEVAVAARHLRVPNGCSASSARRRHLDCGSFIRARCRSRTASCSQR